MMVRACYSGPKLTIRGPGPTWGASDQRALRPSCVGGYVGHDAFAVIGEGTQRQLLAQRRRLLAAIESC